MGRCLRRRLNFRIPNNGARYGLFAFQMMQIDINFSLAHGLLSQHATQPLSAIASRFECGRTDIASFPRSKGTNYVRSTEGGNGRRMVISKLSFQPTSSDSVRKTDACALQKCAYIQTTS
jgi:hypothetical protein